MRIPRIALIALLPLLAPLPVLSSSVIVNEIMYDPARVSDTLGEWFEVRNPGPDSVDLDGWTIRDGGRDSHRIVRDGGLVVPPGGYLVLGRDGDPARNGGYVPDYVYTGFTLSNGEDEILVIDPQGTMVDSVAYGRDGWPVGAGRSIEFIEQSPDNGPGASWSPASAPYGDGDMGTPGAPNDAVPLGIGDAPGNPAGPARPSLRVYPNPFRGTVTIEMDAGTGGRGGVTHGTANGAYPAVEVYDLRGRRVRRLRNGWEAGSGPIVWDGTDDRGAALPPGPYILRLTGEGGGARRKVVIAGG